MLTRQDFIENSEAVIRWIEQYFENLPNLPVKSRIKPGEIYTAIASSIPEDGCTLQDLLTDTTDLILPGITHWQHPNFHAYFPANSSIESLFAEMITSAIAAQCMIWDTSPAAAELEERMLEWMRDAMGLPGDWEGVIQDTASTATLVAIICAREQATNFAANEEGVPAGLRVYCSAQTHSSIEKAVTICGIGRNNLVKIDTDENYRLTGNTLEQHILTDLQNGLTPCCVVAAIGTTGTVAVDDIEGISKICQKYNVWLHIDAAYAGSALFLPEYRWMMKGGENADSFVFNPHKWLFTNFDCTAYYVKDAAHLIKTFEILPEYLKTRTRGEVNDYRDWGIPLGRRFRALKLWYVLRSYGLNGIREKLRKHIKLNDYFADCVADHPDFSHQVPPFLNFSCIRYEPANSGLNNKEIDGLNNQLIEKINASGKAFLSHTQIDGKYVIRVVFGQTYLEKSDVEHLTQILLEQVQKLEI